MAAGRVYQKVRSAVPKNQKPSLEFDSTKVYNLQKKPTGKVDRKVNKAVPTTMAAGRVYQKERSAVPKTQKSSLEFDSTKVYNLQKKPTGKVD